MAAKDTKSDTPLHVAIIMDGNGRWAKQRGWPRLFGHRRGADRAKEIVAACPDLGVSHVTLYAFSTENWKRSSQEVLGLMSLMSRVIRREAKRLMDEGVRLRFIGDREPLNARLRSLMSWIENESADNRRITLTLALNYGGRDEITRAVRALAADVAAGRLTPEEIDEAMISARMDTAGIPDPDLVIRTSGETRISNYLLWQSAYTEYEFTPTLWPDFSTGELAEIIERFRARDRRFGKERA